MLVSRYVGEERDNVYIKTYNNVRMTEVDGDEMTSAGDVMLCEAA